MGKRDQNNFFVQDNTKHLAHSKYLIYFIYYYYINGAIEIPWESLN